MKNLKACLALPFLAATLAQAQPQAEVSNDETVAFVMKISRVVKEHGGKTICLPRNAPLKTLFPALQQYINDHPENQRLSEDDIHQALSKGFPCTGNGSAEVDTVEALRVQGYTVTSISPIFGQLVSFSFPKGFTTVFENTQGIKYIRESVLTGENVQQWSQMITVTGGKGLSAVPDLTPQRYAERVAGAFQAACPKSFSAYPFGNFKIDGFDAFAAIASCGANSSAGAGQSEAALLLVIKGASDFYSLQWAERGAPSATPIAIETAKWEQRLKQLMPVRLCPIVADEQPPYPSCSRSSH